MYDDAYTRNQDGTLAVRTVSTTGDVAVDPNDVMTRDSQGRLCMRVTGQGGGGDVDYSKVVQKSATIPVASATNVNDVYMYTGETNANYTTNYIYKNVKSTTYTGTVSFEAATLSGTTVTCPGDNFANFLTEAGADPTPIVSGTMTYEADANGWRLVGKDSNDNTVTTFIEYMEDYEDAGFVFVGSPEDGDVITFTTTISENEVYSWVRIDVQPGGSGAVSSVNGKTGEVILNAEDVTAVPQYSTMPTASSENEDEIAQFSGTTDSSYTQGYFYKSTRHDIPSSLTATQTVGTGLTFTTNVTTFELYQQPTGDETIEFECKYRMSTYTDWGETSIIGAIGTFDSLLLAHNISMQDDVDWETNSSDVVTMEMLSSGLLSISDQLGAFETFTITMDEFNTYFTDYEGTFEIGEYATCTFSRGQRVWYQNNTDIGTYLSSYGISFYGTPKQHDVVTAIYTAPVPTYSWDNIEIQNSVRSVNGKEGSVILNAEDVNALPQYSTMPSASSEYVGKPVQYIGTTDSDYTYGYVYSCVDEYGEGIATEVTRGSGSSLVITGTDVTVYKNSFPGIADGDVKTFVYKRSLAGASGVPATDAVGSFSVTVTPSDIKTFWQTNIDPIVSYNYQWKTSGTNFSIFQYQGNDTWVLTSPITTGSSLSLTTTDFANANITITGTPQIGDNMWLSGAQGSHWEVSNYYNLCTNVVSNSYGSIGIKYSGQPLLNDEIQAIYSTNTLLGLEWQRMDVQPSGIVGTFLEQLTELPSATAENNGRIVEYIGTTGTYINGYIYKCEDVGAPSGATGTQTVGSSLSNILINKTTFESYVFGGGTPVDTQLVFTYVSSPETVSYEQPTSADMEVSINDADMLDYIHNTLGIASLTSGEIYYSSWSNVWNLGIPGGGTGALYPLNPIPSWLTIINTPSTSASLPFTVSGGSYWENNGNPVNLVNYGITYSGTPVSSDELTVSYTAHVVIYSWVQKNAQPDVTTYAGFDVTKTQVLKNIQGVLTWVDEA